MTVEVATGTDVDGVTMMVDEASRVVVMSIIAVEGVKVTMDVAAGCVEITVDAGCVTITVDTG